MIKQPQMPNGDTAPKAALLPDVVGASQPQEGRTQRMAWPLAVIVIAILSLLGWVAVVSVAKWALSV